MAAILNIYFELLLLKVIPIDWKLCMKYRVTCWSEIAKTCYDLKFKVAATAVILFRTSTPEL